MKNRIKILILFLIFSNLLTAQIIKDLDNDGINDSINFDNVNYKIICKLSTQNFKPIMSQQIETLGNVAGVSETKNGFEFYLSYMRAGYSSQFRYDKSAKKIRLIGMSRYEFGPASNDGSGKSSINLLTNNYIGEWNHFDLTKNELVKLPIIEAKMKFPKIYLERYDESYQERFTKICYSLYIEKKNKLKN